ncbi:PhnD/SsuA/transferrin family substrate-binding protein [Mycobacterium tilburgii]|uniref:PhnD/SsuA/transferrin family substrate-binding protein n=1 Tax=Mycobacterium tilburgii TaxID=44467 RepID=UPI001183EB62|nr:PhnD/SsuA/transferrin family substrate-binding protein [Mycobacterium tilburgii]
MLTRPRRPFGLAALVVLTVVLLAACGHSANVGRKSSRSAGARNPDELVLAAVPSENAQGLQQAYQLLLTLLQRATGKPIRFQSATSYSSAIEAQHAGKAGLRPVRPVLAGHRAEQRGESHFDRGGDGRQGQPRPATTPNGITRPGSGINSVADFRGKKICFADTGSRRKA